LSVTRIKPGCYCSRCSTALRDQRPSRLIAWFAFGLGIFFCFIGLGFLKQSVMAALFCELFGGVFVYGAGRKLFGWQSPFKFQLRPAGYDCPFYSQRMCLAGGGGNECSLGSGNYWSDCYVYSISGLKGKYDKKQGEAARRRAQLKRCKQCKVPLEIASNVDFRYAIREFPSEREFKAASDAVGVSCAVCHTDFCTKCMVTFGKRHPSSGGLACLNCSGQMSEFNP